MNDHDNINQQHSAGDRRPLSELDVLIGRIVDGEATEPQRREFESLAGVDASLWRRLALRHQDMAMLAAHVEPTLNAAEKIELPASGAEQLVMSAPRVSADDARSVASTSTASATRWPWWMAMSGWAALIMFATAWATGVWPLRSSTDHARSSVVSDGILPVNLPPEEYLQQYMQAPYVMGEMPPTLMNIDELSDGRYAVSYLRRIVEVKYYNSPEEIPLDENGLSSSPRELRRVGQRSQLAPEPRD